MVIERIELNHFRNYENLSVQPDGGTNIFFGANGSGKTNLLEAIHYCSLGKSHRMNQDLNVVQMKAEGASCHLWIRTNYARNEVEVRLRPGEDTVKSVWIDQKKASRLSEMMGVLRCVIFSPEDLNLIKEGPAARRKFLDMMISQISRPYFLALQNYRIAMNQRNAILKTARTEHIGLDPMIQDFEISMAKQARIICQERAQIYQMLQEEGQRIYQEISGKENEEFQIVYQPSVNFEGKTDNPMIGLLKKSREDDLRTGGTSLGPHRDELALSLNHKSMRLYASQGQMRTGALSLKLAELMIFRKITHESPVLLLDDVMSELDLNRRMNLLNILEGVQTFITCSDEGDLAEYQNHRTYKVSAEQGLGQLIMIKEGPSRNAQTFQEPDFN